MAVPSRQTGVDTEPDNRHEERVFDSTGVSIHSTSPERSVFIEEDNADGWISTDVTVELER
jgi:hypothetical protein